jgi:hypothetical protein
MRVICSVVFVVRQLLNIKFVSAITSIKANEVGLFKIAKTSPHPITCVYIQRMTYS